MYVYNICMLGIVMIDSYSTAAFTGSATMLKQLHKT